MDTITVKGEEIEYSGLEDKIKEIKESITQFDESFKDTSELGMHKIFHELMNNYLSQNLAPYSDYNGMIRNNFIQLAVKTLNNLQHDEVFQDDYKIIYKKEKLIDRD